MSLCFPCQDAKPYAYVIEGNVCRVLPDEASAVLQVPLLLIVEIASLGKENCTRGCDS